MEPLDENELDRLLQQWDAPPAPGTLKRQVMSGRMPGLVPWWSWLVKGTVRVPVPLALGSALLLAFWMYYSRPVSPPREAQPNTVSLTDFQPVRQLEPILVSGGQK
jgi:hypothetical protein